MLCGYRLVSDSTDIYLYGNLFFSVNERKREVVVQATKCVSAAQNNNKRKKFIGCQYHLQPITRLHKLHLGIHVLYFTLRSMLLSFC